MYRCLVCRLAVPRDDVAQWRGPDRCVCLACYGFHTGTARPMSKALQRLVTEALA